MKGITTGLLSQAFFEWNWIPCEDAR